jgi:E3 ubiquitin-protein ligase DOA10
MTHQEFIAAYTQGEVKVEVDPAGAARFLSKQLLLPFVAMPVAGLGIALALTGWIYSGLAIVAIAYLVPRFIKRSASHFVFQQALTNAAVYEETTQAQILRVVPASE